MPEAARIYGLRRDRWVDERRDPYRSTIAQMDYFHDLYQRFGDWHIALAAFNVGYGNSDESTQGRIPHLVVEDNAGGSFNGSHLMDPRLVPGTLLASQGWGRLLLEDPRLEDVTVEILRQYGIPPVPGMIGRPVFDRDPSTSE